MLQCIPEDVPRLPRLSHLGVVENWKSCSEGHWFCPPESTWPESIGARIPSVKSFLEGVEPRLCFPKQREWEQWKANIIHRSASWVDYAAHFQKILKMSVGILSCLSAEGTCSDHVDKTSLYLKAISALVIVQSSRDMAIGRGWELMECHLSYGYWSWRCQILILRKFLLIGRLCVK